MSISLSRIGQLLRIEAKFALLPLMIIGAQQWMAVVLIVFMPEERFFMLGWVMNFFGLMALSSYLFHFRNQRQYRLALLPVTRQETFISRVLLRLLAMCSPFLVPLPFMLGHGPETVRMVAINYTLPGLVTMILLIAHVLLFLDLSIYFAKNRIVSYGAKVLAIAPIGAIWAALFFTSSVKEALSSLLYSQSGSPTVIGSIFLLLLAGSAMMMIDYRIYNSGNFQLLAGKMNSRGLCYD